MKTGKDRKKKEKDNFTLFIIRAQKVVLRWKIGIFYTRYWTENYGKAEQLLYDWTTAWAQSLLILRRHHTNFFFLTHVGNDPKALWLL